MIRKCPSCNAQIEERDRFCPSCGRAVSAPPDPAAREGNACPLCGQANPSTASSCSSCGAKISDAPPPEKEPSNPGTPRKGVGIFQSWKFTIIVGAILITALIITVTSQKTQDRATPAAPGPAAQGDPHDNPMMQRIRELQAQVEKNPKDAGSTLELANMLYDVQFFDRASEMYERYLAMEPANADARVDLGTSYFQMSFSDSTGSKGLISRAEACFLKAIEVKPDHQLAHFNLGVIHLHGGDMPGARKWFDRCMAIDSTSDAAKRARQLMSEHIQNQPS